MNVPSRNTTASEERQASDLKPIWIRVPHVIAIYGLSRTKAYQLAKDGKITSLSMRESGQKKGTRLFSVASLESYIESFLPEQSESNNND